MIKAFGREIEVLIGDMQFYRDGQNGLDIEFDIPFDDDILANEATITIYNVNPETYNQIRKGQPLIINAGYRGDRGAVFIGEVSKMVPFREKPDSRIVLYGIDSTAFVETDIQKTYAANVKGSTIIRDLINILGLPVGAFDLPNDVTYPRGFTANGKANEYIYQVATDCDALGFMSQGKVYVCSQWFGEETDFVLDENTGMVGSPELEMVGVSKTDTDYVDTAKKRESVYYGKEEKEQREKYRVRSLLNHRFNTAKILSVRSRNYDFAKRIRKGKHICNDGAFFTEMELM